MSRPHAPEYVYCSDPEWCCGHYHPVSVVCVLDGERWPCATKRSHHTEAQADRLQRWSENRRGRAPKGQRP